MPIPPPINQPPYDAIETILYFARIIANDAGVSIAGNLLSDSQPYVLPMLNLAWRKLQDKLSNNGIEEFPAEGIIYGLPAQTASAFADPAVQAYLGYSTYFDGVGNNPSFFLPQDMKIPVRLWERVTGHNAQFMPMVQAKDGLTSMTKSSYLRMWEWRDDAIWFQGANQALDIRIRYKKILTDVAYPNTNVIPLIRCAVALAYLVVEIFATGRGSVMIPSFMKEKDEAIAQIVNETTRKKQRTNFRRQPYSRRGRWW